MRVDPILTTYPTRVRYVSIGVVLAISMIFYGYPRALGEAEKIEFIIQEDIEMIDIPITEKPKEQKAPPKPSTPIASDEDFDDEEYDIFETDFDEWEDWDAPPPDEEEEGNSDFIAYDKAPVPVIPISPVYPEIAKSMGTEGKVFVKFFVDKKGKVDPNKITIVKGVVGLNEAAIEAVKRSKWKPAMQRDMKVGVYMTVPINFVLTRSN